MTSAMGDSLVLTTVYKPQLERTRDGVSLGTWEKSEPKRSWHSKRFPTPPREGGWSSAVPSDAVYK